MRFARPNASLRAFLLAMAVACPCAMTAPAAAAAIPGAAAAAAPAAPAELLAVQAGDRRLTWEDALAELSAADVVFLGENHGDAATHRLQRALLEALHRASDKPLALSLEMFERDVQPALDAYLQGRIPEGEFLAQSRPWPGYAQDYRPLVEYAKAHGLPVIAANVPRRLAGRVAKEGLAGLEALPPDERLFAASTVDVPEGRLWERFQEMMASHPGMGEATLKAMFAAQCLKDATMAESIAAALCAALPAAGSPRVLHINGAFHSDEGLGVPAQLRARHPRFQQAVTTVLPAATADAAPVLAASGAAELVFVVRRDPEAAR